MEKLKINKNYQVVLIILVLLLTVGIYFCYAMNRPPENLHQNQSQTPGHTIPLTPAVQTSTRTTSPTMAVSGSTHNGLGCNTTVADSRIPVPANISVAIRDPVPGIQYSLNENDSGRTIILRKGEIVEINLRWIPGLGYHWIIPVTGCGIELVNAGTYSDGGDFWNNTGHYRVRYQAVSTGTSDLDGKYILVREEEGDPGFNLTVIVK